MVSLLPDSIKRVVVTGGAGFIGGAAVLNRAGYRGERIGVKG